MPELDTFGAFCRLINVHFPTYFYSVKTKPADEDLDEKTLVGAWAGSFLSWDILRICDRDLFDHLSGLHPYQYFFPIVSSFQVSLFMLYMYNMYTLNMYTVNMYTVSHVGKFFIFRPSASRSLKCRNCGTFSFVSECI